MRIIRYRTHGQTFWGRIERDGRLSRLDRAPWEAGLNVERTEDVPQEERLAPAVPTKIVCVGRNYAAHAGELGNEVPKVPLLFLKPPSAVVGPGTPILIPPEVGEVHHEAELAVVMGRRLGAGASTGDARAAILGLTCANDVTARAIQREEGKFTRAKGFDTFCPVGPEVVSGLDPAEPRKVICRVDGETRQEGSTADLVFPVLDLLSFVAGVMTLEPGDLVLTGTPSGVGPVEPGQTVEVEVEGVGVLVSPVRARR